MTKHVKHTEASGRSMECGHVIMRIVDGIVVHIELSWAKTYQTWGNVVMNFVGTKGNSSVDAFKQHSLNYNDVEEKIGELPWLEDIDASLISDFTCCVKSSGVPSIKGMDGLRTLEVVKAVYRSSELKKRLYSNVYKERKNIYSRNSSFVCDQGLI